MDKKKISSISKSIQTDFIELNEKMKLLNNIFSLLLSISNKNSKNKILDEYTIVLKNYKEFINNIMNKLTEIPFYLKYKNIIMELNEKIFTLYKNLKILYIIFKLSYSISNENKKENIKDEYNKTIKDHKLFITELIKNLDDIKKLFNKENEISQNSKYSKYSESTKATINNFKKFSDNTLNEFYKKTGITPEELSKNINPNITLKNLYEFLYKEKIDPILKKYNLNTKVNFNKVKADLLKNKNQENIDNNLYNELLKIIIIYYYTEKTKKIASSNINVENYKLNKLKELKEELNEDKKYINNASYNKLSKFINDIKKIIEYKIYEIYEYINEKIITNTGQKEFNTNMNLENFLTKFELEFGKISTQNLPNKNNSSINLPNYLKNQEKFKEKLNEINKLENKSKIKNEINKLESEIIDFIKYISNDDFAIFLLEISKLSKKKNIK